MRVLFNDSTPTACCSVVSNSYNISVAWCNKYISLESSARENIITFNGLWYAWEWLEIKQSHNFGIWCEWLENEASIIFLTVCFHKKETRSDKKATLYGNKWRVKGQIPNFLLILHFLGGSLLWTWTAGETEARCKSLQLQWQHIPSSEAKVSEIRLKKTKKK